MPASPTAVRVLFFHAPYQCRDSGACCTAGWPIPVEAGLQRTIARAVVSGRLRISAPAGDAPERALLDWPPDAPHDTPARLRADADGVCVCYERTARRCAIHRQLGHASLPAACRHFPRIVVNDPRGCHVTLSHFCPTAASLLFDTPSQGGGSLIQAPRAWPAEPLEGLDARGALPPLLHPTLLMDWEGWEAWEQGAVSLLLEPGLRPGARLARLAAAVEHVRTWRPGQGRLAERVVEALGRRSAPAQIDEVELRLLAQQVRRSVPEDLRTPATRAPIPGLDPGAVAEPVARFLAAHAYANWAAWQGRGLRTWVRAVAAAWAVLTGEVVDRLQAGRPLGAALLTEAVRETDRLLRHLVSPERLAAHLSLYEDDPVRLVPAPERR